MFFRTTIPFSRYNHNLQLTADQRSILIKHSNNFFNQNFVDPLIVGTTNDPTTRFHAKFLQKSFVYLITETACEYPYPYFTEKTWKAMINGCPFLMINAPGSLAKLHEYGFKTFNDWWNEGYDNIPLAANRIEAVIKILNDLSALSLNELQDLKNSMENIIDFNYNHLQTFRKIEIERITNEI